LRTEIWFDSERQLKKTIQAIDGAALDQELQTGHGGWSQAGPIITCSWIAAHPVHATRLRVSCNPDGDNGTVPRTVREAPPTLDPALSGFVDHYRSALASGAAKKVGVGTFAGREVFWLEFAAGGRTERVAVDADTYKPLAIEGPGHDPTLRVTEATAVAYEASFFTKPPQVPVQRGSSIGDGSAVDVETAAKLLGGQALWLDASWNGLHLVSTTHMERRLGYGPGRAPGHAELIRLTYAPTGPDGTPDFHARVEIYESRACIVSVGWECNAQDPVAPNEFKQFAWISLLRRSGLYVSVWNVPGSRDSISIARALVQLKS
jgi:hypothetical protein